MKIVECRLNSDAQAFSVDGRWIVTASADETMRIWDIPTGNCIDWIKFRSCVTSLCWSLTGAFITTAHADSGVNNKTCDNFVVDFVICFDLF